MTFLQFIDCPQFFIGTLVGAAACAVGYFWETLHFAFGLWRARKRARRTFTASGSEEGKPGELRAPSASDVCAEGHQGRPHPAHAIPGDAAEFPCGTSDGTLHDCGTPPGRHRRYAVFDMNALFRVLVEHTLKAKAVPYGTVAAQVRWSMRAEHGHVQLNGCRVEVAYDDPLTERHPQ